MTVASVSLGDVADFVNGAAFSERDWSEDGLKIIRIQNLTDPSKPFNRTTRVVKDALRVRPGDLLVSWSATLGVFEWFGPEDAVLNQHIFRVLPNHQRVDKHYLRHVLVGAVNDMDRHVHGATMKHINRGEFIETEIPLPPIEEQRRIAAVLDAADALRAKRRQTLAKLDTLTQAIFIDMFGDPVSNPLRWPVEPFASQIGEVRYGTGSPPPYVGGDGVPFVRATDIKNGRIRTTGMKRISTVDAEVLSKCRLRSGELIIVRSGVNTGDCAVVPDELDGACAAYDMIVSLAPHNAHFYHFLLNSERGRRLVEPLTRRAAQPHLNASQVRDLPLIAPPTHERQRFATQLACVARARLSMEDQVTHLDALFASLQHRAFRGEL